MDGKQGDEMKLPGQGALCFALLLTFGFPAAAQHRHGAAMPGHSAGAPPTAASPYAGMAGREVKALSEQQIADLKAGRGMGLALAGELNGYPGPAHVLELADALQLTPEQRRRTQALFEAMKTETVPIGERIIADEVSLDRLFYERRVTQQLLDDATARIGAAQGALRGAHLRYHLAIADLLTPVQTARYAELRGYTLKGHDRTHLR